MKLMSQNYNDSRVIVLNVNFVHLTNSAARFGGGVVLMTMINHDLLRSTRFCLARMTKKLYRYLNILNRQPK